MVSVEYLQERFSYDPDTGILTWRNGPRAGYPVGRLNAAGYLRVNLKLKGKRYFFYVHRIAFAIMAGAWPKDKIDHRNGNPSDNRLVNLREATDFENQHNRITKPTCGTVFLPKLGRFRAAIYSRGKAIVLGNFPTREEAHACYLAAKATLHPFQPVPREVS